MAAFTGFHTWPVNRGFVQGVVEVAVQACAATQQGEVSMNVSMKTRRLAFAALALAATASAGLAQARGPVDVQWQVTIGSPVGGYPGRGGVVVAAPVYVPVYVPVYRPTPVFLPAPLYVPAPVPPSYTNAYRQPTRWDVDGDGIPNRYDRVYNPRRDVDGDGIPNRHDRHDGDRRRCHPGANEGYEPRGGYRGGR